MPGTPTPREAPAEPLLRLLGLARRASHLVIGVDGVRSALQQEQVWCVVLASDASPRAEEKVVRLAAAKGVPLLTGPTADAIGERLGKPPVMVVGVRDHALAKGIEQLAPERL